MLEVEQKYWLAELPAFESQLSAIGAVATVSHHHEDEYFNHPARDFAATKEALRIRRIDGLAHITYKGPRLAGAIKAREELEWSLAPGDADGALTARLWRTLGFHSVAVVKKHRRLFSCIRLGSDLSITIDDVAGVGLLAEIEIVVSDVDSVEPARRRIEGIAETLHLDCVEPRSYLSLWLASHSTRET